MESTEERVKKGKNKTSLVSVSFLETHSGRFKIRIEDDGRGLDLEKIKEVALRKNLILEKELNSLTENEVSNFIFMSGFSSKDNITTISGRGVGMDVVKMEVQKIGGNIFVKTKKDQGIRITIDLPLFR